MNIKKPVQMFIVLMMGLLSWDSLQAVSHSDLQAELNLMDDSKRLLYREVADQLRCPTCSGVSVLQSDAPFSQQIKLVAAQQINQGADGKVVMDFFTERYGLWIMRSPPTEGFHLLAWLGPIAVLIMGPFILWLIFWRRRRDLGITPIRSADDILQEMAQSINALKRGQS